MEDIETFELTDNSKRQMQLLCKEAYWEMLRRYRCIVLFEGRRLQEFSDAQLAFIIRWFPEWLSKGLDEIIKS